MTPPARTNPTPTSPSKSRPQPRPRAAPPPTTPAPPQPGRARSPSPPTRRRRRGAHDVPADHHRQRDHLGAGGGARPHRGRDPDRLHRRTCAGDAACYFFARPADMLAAIWQSVSGAYSALFQGSVYNFRRDTFAAGIRPLTETLTFATPLIAGGLGVALAFRVGMFNIGGRGQMLIAASVAGWIGFGVRPAVGRAHDRRPRRRPRRRRALGRHRRSAQGPHRGARGDRDDHAELHRVLPRVVPAANAGPAAGARFEQPEDARR